MARDDVRVKPLRRQQANGSTRPYWRPIPAWSWMLTAAIAVALTAFVITKRLLTIASHAAPGTDQATARLDDKRNMESDGYRYTELVAPVFAGFSLPAIITFASSTYPGPPWHNVVLSLLLIATSLFISSIGLMTTPIREKWPKRVGALRGLLSGIGICVISVALFILGLRTINEWWAPLVLSPLLLGSIVPAVISLMLLRQDTPSQRQ